ncbi:MAG: hypothetical protein RIR26_1073 [Pseudomonadota bacterium]
MGEGQLKDFPKSQAGDGRSARWQWSFAARANTFLVAVVLILFSGLGWFVWLRVKEEQFPYLLEIQHSKSRYMEARMRSFLRNRTGSELVRIDAVGLSPEMLYLLRWPVGDEVFVGTADVNIVYGRHDEETLWFRPLEDLSSFWSAEDGFSYAITTGGINIGSSRPERMSAKSGMKRKEIDEFFRSGVAAGTRIYKDPLVGDRVVSHHEVAGTNVVLFSENEIKTLNEERARDLQLILWGLALAALITLLVGLYFIRILVRPLRIVLRDANEVSFGNFPASPKLEFRDEVHTLNGVVLVIKQRLKNLLEAQRLDQAQRKLCHDFMRQVGRARKQEDVLQCFVSALTQHPNPLFHSVDLSCHIPASSQGEAASSIFLKRNLLTAGKASPKREPEWSSEMLPLFSAHEEKLNKGDIVPLNADELLAPVKLGSLLLACLYLRGRGVGKISPLDSRWLAFLCRIIAISLWNLPDETQPERPS